MSARPSAREGLPWALELDPQADTGRPAFWSARRGPPRPGCWPRSADGVPAPVDRTHAQQHWGPACGRGRSAAGLSSPCCQSWDGGPGGRGVSLAGSHRPLLEGPPSPWSLTGSVLRGAARPAEAGGWPAAPRGCGPGQWRVVSTAALSEGPACQHPSPCSLQTQAASSGFPSPAGPSLPLPPARSRPFPSSPPGCSQGLS